MANHPSPAAQQQIEQRLTDYLSGYVRNSPANLAHVIEYQDWQRMARQELDRRASKLLAVLPEEELQAIAEGRVSLPDLAKSLAT
jgi:Lon protease-like protein